MPIALQIIVAFLTIIYALHRYAVRYRAFPRDVPWAGKRAWFLATTLANVWDLWAARENLAEGYEKYTKCGLAFISPTFHRHPEVILLSSDLIWLAAQQDDVVSIGTVLQEDLHFPYTSPRSWDFKTPYHLEALNKMRLDLLTDGLMEEIRDTFDGEWGKTQEWKEVRLAEVLESVLMRTTMRAVVGEPLCRESEFCDAVGAFIKSLGMQSIQISLFVPFILRPLLASWLARPVRAADTRVGEFLVPIVEEGLKTAEQSRARKDRNDLLDWTVRLAVKSPEARDRDPKAIASRLLSLSFVGVHTSFITLSNAMLDLISTPQGPTLYEELRQEAARALKDANGVWTKKAVGDLRLMDSFLRESMRVNVFKARGIERQVIARSGVILPNGTYLPYGTRIGFPTLSIHNDPEFYEDPQKFKPRRFLEGGGNVGFVNTSPWFLGFGYGRHACPGRFFSAHEIKLIVAHIVVNYDIEALDERPPNSWGADFCVPNGNVGVRVRRTI